MSIIWDKTFCSLIFLAPGAAEHVEECAPGAPGELVSQGVVRTLRGGQAAAERDEGLDLAATLGRVIETLHGEEVVNAGVHPALIDYSDPGLHSGTVLGLEPG